MLSQVVLIQQLLLHSCLVWVQLQGMEVHKGHFFQHGGIVDGLGSILTPGERAVAVYEDGGDLGGVFVREGFPR